MVFGAKIIVSWFNNYVGKIIFFFFTTVDIFGDMGDILGKRISGEHEVKHPKCFFTEVMTDL